MGQQRALPPLGVYRRGCSLPLWGNVQNYLIIIVLQRNVSTYPSSPYREWLCPLLSCRQTQREDKLCPFGSADKTTTFLHPLKSFRPLFAVCCPFGAKLLYRALWATGGETPFRGVRLSLSLSFCPLGATIRPKGNRRGTKRKRRVPVGLPLWFCPKGATYRSSSVALPYPRRG